MKSALHIMRLVDIYRARWDGRPEVALAAACERLKQLETEQSPQWWEMWTHLMFIKGDCYLDMGRNVEAENCFDCIYAKTAHPASLANRAYSKWSQGRLPEAKEDYLARIRLPMTEQEKDVLYRQLASLCIDMNDIGEAQAFLECAKIVSGDTAEIEALRRKIAEISRH